MYTVSVHGSHSFTIALECLKLDITSCLPLKVYRFLLSICINDSVDLHVQMYAWRKVTLPTKTNTYKRMFYSYR